MSQTIAVIGLGLMGSRMSDRLLAGGYKLRGFDTNAVRLREFEEKGGQPTASPAAAVEGSWAALLSLPDSDIAREVCLGDAGISTSGVSPLYIYDTTTGRPGDAEDVALALARFGITYSDTTVSGNGEVAERGQLVVMIGGPVEAYDAGRPIFETIGRSHHHVGNVGSGATMKLIVNQVLSIHRMALAEALVTAEMSGLDPNASLEVLKDGLSYSKAMDVWGERMIAGAHDAPFSRLRQSHKDARLIVEHGRKIGSPTDLIEVVRDALAWGESTGLGDLDNSSIIEVVRSRTGQSRTH